MGKNKVKVTGFRIYDENILEKIDIIASKNRRRRNEEVNYALEKHVADYEAQHGEVKLPTETEKVQGGG